MKTSIAILGSGGKMGFPITRKLVDAGHDVCAIEVAEIGMARSAEAGIRGVAAADGVPGAKVVILALPDTIIGRVACELVPMLAPGTMLLILDAAAPYAGVLPPDQPHLTYFVGHPCHPPLFNEQTDMAARKDYHGGVAPQSIVCALMQGPEGDYALGEAICRDMWSPIIKSHRVTVERLAIQEPGRSEMVAMPFVDTMVEAVEECANNYCIEREAAFDFLMGHLNVEIAMWFGFSPKVPSEAAHGLMRFAKSVVVREDWRAALSPAKVSEAATLIVNS